MTEKDAVIIVIGLVGLGISTFGVIYQIKRRFGIIRNFRDIYERHGLFVTLSLLPIGFILLGLLSLLLIAVGLNVITDVMPKD